MTPGPTETELREALAVVRGYLSQNGDGERTASAETLGAKLEDEDGATAPSAQRVQTTRPAAPAVTQMSVDGNIDAISFTGDGSNLAGVATDGELAAHAGDSAAHHTPTVDTTCNGAACDGTSFSNVTAVAGDSATAFFSSGEIEEARIDQAIARDSEVAGLAGWSLTGNAGTSPPINFIGTTDPQPLELRANDTTLLRLAVDAEAFLDSSSSTPLDIPDNNPLGLTDSIVVPDRGIASGLAVSVHLTNSDLTTILVELTDPNATTYTLFAGGTAGTVLNTSFPTPTPPVSGDLTTWIGQNPAGTWELKVVDSGFLNNTTDGQLVAWSIDLETLSDPNVQVASRLAVTGDISSSGILTATSLVGDGSALTGIQQRLSWNGTTGALTIDNGGQASGNSVTVLGTGSVNSQMILDGTVTGADVASNTLTSADIATGAIGGAEILDGAVTSVDIANASITGTDVASNTLTAADIASNAIGVSELDMSAIFEPAVITSAGSNDTIDTVYTTGETVASRSVTVPTNGRIVAIATADYVYCNTLNSTNTRCDLYHTLSTSSTASANAGSYQRCALLYTGGTPQSYDYRTCSVMGVFTVSTGTTTIYWRAGVGNSPEDTVIISNGDLVTIFLPN